MFYYIAREKSRLAYTGKTNGGLKIIQVTYLKRPKENNEVNGKPLSLCDSGLETDVK